MAHPALEDAVSLPAMLGGEEFEVMDRANVQDRRPCAFLLVFVGCAGGKSLDGHTVGLADFEVGCWWLVVRLDRDRAPWAVAAVSHRSASTADG